MEHKVMPITAIHQYEISMDAIQRISAETTRDHPFYGYTLRRLMQGGYYYGDVYPSRLKSAGFYLLTGTMDGYETIIVDPHHPPSSPKTWTCNQTRNPMESFSFLRVYSGYMHVCNLPADQWKYFTYVTTYRLDDIIMKNSNYHKIIGFSIDNHHRKKEGVIFHLESMVTGTKTSSLYGKIPKLKRYELSDKQLQNVSEKQRQMEERVRSALSNIKTELVPRRCLGFQSNFVHKLEEKKK